jgi:hypothetical protein
MAGSDALRCPRDLANRELPARRRGSSKFPHNFEVSSFEELR